MSRNRILAVVFSLSLMACGEDDSSGQKISFVPVPGCEHLDHAPCDTLQTDCQLSRLELAACLRGCPPGDLPPVNVLTEDAYAEVLSSRYAERPRPNPDHWEWAMSQLHLVAPGAFQPSPLIMAEVEQIAGFYSDETHGITLIDHGSPAADARSNAVLLHELVHALQDRDVTLGSYLDDGADTSDEALSLSSVIEGEARLHQDRYAASLSALDPARLDFSELFEQRIRRGETWALGEPSPWLASRKTFPYDYGERFVHFAWQSGGRDAVLHLFANPPRTSWALMASTDEPRDSPSPSELSAPTPPEGWTLLDEDEFGAHGLFFALSRSESGEQFRPPALAWRSDLLAVYSGPGDPPATALVWQIDVSDESNAAAVAGRLAALLTGIQVRRLGTRVVIAHAGAPILLDWAFAAP